MTSRVASILIGVLVVAVGVGLVLWLRSPARITVPVPPSPAVASAVEGDVPETPAEEDAGEAAAAQDETAAEDEEELEAPSTARQFTGTVSDAETGQAVSGAMVALIPDAVDEEEIPDAAEVSADTLADGTYTIVVPEGMAVRAVFCTADGYGMSERPVSDKDGDAPVVDFVLKPAAAIAGRVGEARTRRAVEGVKVAARRYGTGGWADAMTREAASGVTDADGRYVLGGLEPGAYRVYAAGEDLGYVMAKDTPTIVSLEPRETRDGVDFDLEPGAAVTGTVRDAQGRPVAKAQVMAIPAQFLAKSIRAMSSARPEELVRGTVTDDSGAYTVMGLQFATDYRVMAGAEGLASASAGPFQVPRAQTAPYRLDVTLTQGSTVAGRIRHADGRPASGRRVTLMPEFARLMLGEVQEPKRVETGNDGAFSFDHVSAGVYTVQFRGPDGMQGFPFGGASAETVEVDGVRDIKGIELVLAAETEAGARTLSGIVVDAADAPVADARVYIRGKGMMPESQSKQTDADGAFLFENLQSAEFDVGAVADAGRADKADVAVGSKVRLVLGAGARISGVVRDASGVHQADCRVSLRKVEASSGIEAMFGGMFAGGEAATTDEQGAFEFVNIAADAYILEAEVADKGKATQQVTVGPGEAQYVSLVLNPGVRFAGRVRETSGRALEGAMVKLVPYQEESPMAMMSSILGSMMPGPGATTDSEGRFEMKGVQEGTYSVTATCNGYANAPAEQVAVGTRDVTGHDIVLSKGGRARGQYLRDGQPMAGQMIQLIGPGGIYMVTTDANGEYDIEGITPGRYMAQLVDPSQLAAGNLAALNPQQFVMDIADGQDLPLDLGPRGNASVTGRIEGEDLGNVVSVSIRRPGGPNPEDLSMGNINAAIDAASYFVGQAMMNPDGTYTVSGLAPGTYVLEVYSVNVDLSNPNIAALMSMDRTPQIRQELVIPDDNPVQLNLNVPNRP